MIISPADGPAPHPAHDARQLSHDPSVGLHTVDVQHTPAATRGGTKGDTGQRPLLNTLAHT